MPRLPYADRREAGRVLAEHLQLYARQAGAIVLGLPRGGIEVAYEVAHALDLPLDVLIVRKLGAPMQPELAIGAIASGGGRVLNTSILQGLGIDAQTLEAITAQEQQELDRRERLYRGDRPALALELRGRTVIIVDDGLATGATMTAAIRAIRQMEPTKLICAVPIAAPNVCRDIAREVDEMVCPATPEHFFGVGRWYERFDPTTDEQVRELLRVATESQ